MFKIKNYLSRFLKFSLFFLSFLIIIYGINLFYTGFHNIDIAWNEERISLAYGIDLEESTLQGQMIPLKDAYKTGLWQIRAALYLTLIGGMTFGILLVDAGLWKNQSI